eukprot:g4846.t1
MALAVVPAMQGGSSEISTMIMDKEKLELEENKISRRVMYTTAEAGILFKTYCNDERCGKRALLALSDDLANDVMACRKVFADYDTDGSGFIDDSEIAAMMTELPRNIGDEVANKESLPKGKEDAEKLLGILDVDGNGQISEDEFLAWYIGGKERSPEKIAEFGEKSEFGARINCFHAAVHFLVQALQDDLESLRILKSEEDAALVIKVINGGETLSMEEFVNWIACGTQSKGYGAEMYDNSKPDQALAANLLKSICIHLPLKEFRDSLLFSGTKSNIHIKRSKTSGLLRAEDDDGGDMGVKSSSRCCIIS